VADSQASLELSDHAQSSADSVRVTVPVPALESTVASSAESSATQPSPCKISCSAVLALVLDAIAISPLRAAPRLAP
jgi:hypothetical protein